MRAGTHAHHHQRTATSQLAILTGYRDSLIIRMSAPKGPSRAQCSHRGAWSLAQVGSREVADEVMPVEFNVSTANAPPVERAHPWPPASLLARLNKGLWSLIGARFRVEH